MAIVAALNSRPKPEVAIPSTRPNASDDQSPAASEPATAESPARDRLTSRPKVSLSHSLVLASQTAVLPQNSGELGRSLVPVAAAMLGVVVGVVLLRRWLPHVPILNQMMLEPPAGEEAEEISRRESLVDLEDFVGARGITTTQLTPSGKARFGEMLVDVITDGEVIGRGTEIEVVQVQGNRVIVRGGEKE